MKRYSLCVLLFFFCVLFTNQSSAEVAVTVLDKEVIANIQIAGVYQCTLKITFEEVIGLTQNSLNITALQVNPLDQNLLRRLTDPSLMTIPSQFPILISISPTNSSTLSFTGAVDIELSTSNLVFVPNTPLRFFTSPASGTFEDFTNFAGVGSYRVRGTGGDFSDFLIIADTRTNDQAIQNKFQRLQQSLNFNAGRIHIETLNLLQSKLDSASANYRAGRKTDAASDLEEMINIIKADNGETIPNTYRANDSVTRNVAGELRKKAATLVFSLRL